ncbi:MAG: methylcobalamin:coenzyme M methyltransferase [Planctomycetes bacterium ADurb.Bin126]|nr:MAG: methylcobalamin:coenzyme M methyltransferase [Planctomycetes bacterium ADurb.Bin126]HOD80334.1 uroporphyrinogen decarboxylase family protein [Phycisphaerae bacterium]HQL75085.1 uroporphyrinogen decarboxylase family protein [Phycisphaerae bacterium]
MISRERLQTALAHRQVDRPPMDFGATHVTGINVTTVHHLRQALLGEKDYRVKVTEPYQMLGEIDPALAEALGVDVVGVMGPRTMFGFENRDWKELRLFDGTDVLVPGQFNITTDDKGDWYIHPEGDTSVPPSGHMPKDGFYFDAICRQEPIDEDHLDVRDNTEEFGPLTPETLDFMAASARSAADAGKGAILSVPGTAFGDIALVPAMWMKRTKGIREVAEWYMATVAQRDYVWAIFEKQCEIALANLARLADALGDNVQAAFTTGTDFGTQNGLFISPNAYRDLYQPFHKQINAFIHERTNWKVFIHSCGAVAELIPDLIESGFDILNPVQCSARGMDPQLLKDRFGDRLTFWGGAVDTQKTLPFGTPREVYDEVRQRIDILGKDGGFVFNTIHNIQARIPIDNVLALFKAYRDSST